MFTYYKMVNVLELFKGTGSVGIAVKEKYPDWNVVSLDILKKFNPDICIDILEWNYKEYSVGYFDIIWASPECKIFSILQNTFIGRKWKSKEHLEEERKKNWCFVLKVLEIIEYFKPVVYLIENPYNSAMKDIPDMKKLKSYQFDYCAFGFPYKKPTRIWSNINLISKTCKCKKHAFNLGKTGKLALKSGHEDDKTTLKQRYSIPITLLDYLFEESFKSLCRRNPLQPHSLFDLNNVCL